MTILRPWTNKMFEVLEDRQWHDIEDVIQAGVLVVPPGMAYRRGEALRSRNHPERDSHDTSDMSDSIAAGARHIVLCTITNHVSLGRIARQRDEVRILEDPNSVAPTLPMTTVWDFDLVTPEVHSSTCAKAVSQQDLWEEKRDSISSRRDLIVLLILREDCDCGNGNGQSSQDEYDEFDDDDANYPSFL